MAKKAHDRTERSLHSRAKALARQIYKLQLIDPEDPPVIVEVGGERKQRHFWETLEPGNVECVLHDGVETLRRQGGVKAVVEVEGATYVVVVKTRDNNRGSRLHYVFLEDDREINVASLRSNIRLFVAPLAAEELTY